MGERWSEVRPMTITVLVDEVSGDNVGAATPRGNWEESAAKRSASACRSR